MDVTTWIIILKHRSGKSVVAYFNRDGKENGWFSDITSLMREVDAWGKATQRQEMTNYEIIATNVDNPTLP